MSNKDIKLEFSPGCFDEFEGTQAELDELVADINKMFESGELLNAGELVDLDDGGDEYSAVLDVDLNLGKTLH